VVAGTVATDAGGVDASGLAAGVQAAKASSRQRAKNRERHFFITDTSYRCCFENTTPL